MTDFPYGATLNLTERLKRRERGATDADRGRRRLDLWAADEPFGEGEYFARRLDLEGLDREQLVELLGESIEEAPGERPEWLARLERYYADDPPPHERVELPARFRRTAGSPFWSFVEPLVRHTTNALVERLHPLTSTSGPIRDERLVELIHGGIPFQVLNWPVRSLVLEMNIARLSGDLTHEDPKERFRQFAERLGEGQRALAVFREVPVLARQLVELMDVWAEVMAEIFERLVDGWATITETFPDLEADDILARVELGAGDRHRNGRSVALLLFASGRRLVYKPRSLAIAVAFQDVLRTLETEGFEPALPPTAVLDRGDHGFMEHLVPEPCATLDGVRRFYVRQGAYLALLYTLRATDIHFENLIAVGETPYIVDLESLLQPGPPPDDPVADDLLRNSLVEVGLLPVRNWENETSPGLDVSGFGGPEGQQPPRPEVYWADHGSDTMHYARKSEAIDIPSHHRPTVGDRPATAVDYVDAIVEGFSSLYRHLMARRQAWLADDGPIAPMLDQEVRVLLRPTAAYGLMLRESFHPDLLRDALSRQRFFDKLWKQVPRRPCLERLIASEHRALWQRDIPLFTAKPRSRALFTPDGEALDDFFSQSAAEGLAERLLGYSEADLERQIWFVRASLALLSTADPEHETAPQGRPSRGRSTATVSFEEAASRIGRHLVEQADRGETIRWAGVRPAPRGAFKLGYLDDSLYGGQAGVTLFLGCLGEILGDPTCRQLAQDSCETLLRRASADGVEASVGAFTGSPGLAYTFDQLAVLWGDPGLRASALDLLRDVEAAIDEDDRFDIVSGSAGLLLVLSALRRDADDPLFDRLTERAARHLADRAVERPAGCGWITLAEAEEPLAGFSHGAGGIAAALAVAAAEIGEARYVDIAHRAVAYERSLFRAERGNWRDLRTDEDAADPVNWCHGAPGIIFSRALMLRHVSSDTFGDEIRVAARTTAATGFGRNHCLCHGDLGNLEALVLADRVCADLDLTEEIERRTSDVAESLARDGWRCGLPMAVETPGLMVGLAGIGLGLLRRLQPDRVPSILALEPIGAPRDRSPRYTVATSTVP